MNETARIWILRGLALGIAGVIWLFGSLLPRLEVQSAPTNERDLEATVVYQVPEGFTVLNKRPTVLVRVRGRADIVRSVRSDQVNLQVPFPAPGDFTINQPVEVGLSRSDVALPEGLEVVSLTPDALTLLIDEERRKRLPVRATFSGEPVAGRTRADVEAEITPDHVVVQGPASRVANLDVVETLPINLDGHGIDFQQQVGVRVEDEYVRVLQPDIVTVTVRFRSERASESAGTF